MKMISAILILVSFTASLYNLFVGLAKPETVAVYNKANIPHLGIQSLALILGVSGILLLFPQTFKLAGVLLVLHSLFTIGCFVSIKNFRGGFTECLFLQIPIFLLWAGYPMAIFEKFRDLFS
jgi:hypothetical protein